MAAKDDFLAWALSPDRTLEEAYLAERLVEDGYWHWCISNQHKELMSFEQKMAWHNKRRLNPAHRVQLDPAHAARAAEKLFAMDRLSLDGHSDRPLRDLSGLRFFDHFQHLSLSGHEFTDISVLRRMTRAESLTLSSAGLEDFTPIAALTRLTSLHLYLREPWPVIRGFEALTELESFHWHGNLLPLEDIPRFGKLRVAKINHGCSSLPLRNATRLPDMPWLEELELENLHRLDGITRWPRLRNLILGGPFKDLRALAGLRALTHLELRGELTRDLTPLAQLPELRKLTIRGAHPQDYSVLAEAPRLHEVAAEGCRINKMELAALHAALAPWEDEFAVPEPRPRGRACFAVRKVDDLPKNPRDGLGPEAHWHDDKKMASSEQAWFAETLGSALGGLLGRKGWGRVWTVSCGLGWITVNTLEAAEQLPVIVETTRQVLCGTARPWRVHLGIDLDNPDGDWDDEEEETEEQEIQRELEDIKDYKQRRKEEEEYLEREHRMRLLQQEGKPLNPAEFAGPDDAANFTVPASDEDEDDEEDGETEPQATVAERLWMHGVITEEGFFADDRARAAAEHLMGRKAEDAAA